MEGEHGCCTVLHCTVLHGRRSKDGVDDPILDLEYRWGRRATYPTQDQQGGEQVLIAGFLLRAGVI